MANIADVYDRDNAGRDAITKKRVQLLERQLEQLHETMLAKFATLQVGRQPHHHPTLLVITHQGEEGTKIYPKQL